MIFVCCVCSVAALNGPADSRPQAELTAWVQREMRSRDSLVSAVTCRAAEGGDDTPLILRIPKTGSRHWVDIMAQEYGLSALYGPRVCPRMVHVRPSAGRIVSEAGVGCPKWVSVFTASVISQYDMFRRKASALTLTVLRDPIDRLLSEFYFQRQPLASHLRVFLSAQYSTNMQLGYLSAKRWCLSAVQPLGCYDPHREVTDQDLHKVVGDLKSGVLVAGVVEDLKTSIQMFASVLRWRSFDPDRYSSYGPRNVSRSPSLLARDRNDRRPRSPSRAGLNASELADLQHRNSLDYELYRAAAGALRRWQLRNGV